MKFKFFNSRGKFSPTLSLGKLMWICTNGHPNYETEYSIIGIEWWNFQCSIMFLKVKHTKTTEQINECLNENLVL